MTCGSGAMTLTSVGPKLNCQAQGPVILQPRVLASSSWKVCTSSAMPLASIATLRSRLLWSTGSVAVAGAALLSVGQGAGDGSISRQRLDRSGAVESPLRTDTHVPE